MAISSGRIEQIFQEHLAVAAAAARLVPEIERAAHLMADALRGGGTILAAGNGGSAADAQHLACELVGRFFLERRGLPAVALHADTSVMTAVANDYGYDRVFARQVEALGKPGDLLVAISTSGNSPNVVAAAEAARARSLRVLGLTGQNGGRLAELADACLCVPSGVTPRVQEIHEVIIHAL